MLRLQLVLRGIKRCHGDQTRVRLPITIHHLKLFSMLLAIPTTQNFNSLLIWAAMTLDSITFSSAVGTETPEFMTILIKESKTDPFRLGHTITIGSTMSDICPVKAIKSYLAVRPNAQGPLLVHASGKPLTKQTLINETRKLLIKSGFKASIGAATTAAKAKLPSWLIKTLGRWSSDCYERYIKTPTTTLSGVSAMLANTGFF